MYDYEKRVEIPNVSLKEVQAFFEEWKKLRQPLKFEVTEAAYDSGLLFSDNYTIKYSNIELGITY